MAARIARAKSYIETTFPGSVLRDEHLAQLQYQISDPTATLARLFGALEAARADLGVEDYSISQTTLEQIFVGFAREQREHERPARRGCCRRCWYCCCYYCCGCC